MDLHDYKSAQRANWETGDYRPIGRLLEPAARELVDRAGVTAAHRVLDVGAGSGNVAIAAARTGATVLGVDITDRWFAEARRRADAEHLDIDLAVGDAEDLPVAGSSFDVVLSNFAAIFAPRHHVVAAELARVCRPGGTIGLTAWPPDGATYQLCSTLSDALPAPPPFALPPGDWARPDHARRLLSRHGAHVTFARRSIAVHFASIKAFESLLFDNSGGYINARRALIETGRWQETYERLHRAVQQSNEADDGSYRAAWDYLLVTAALPA